MTIMTTMQVKRMSLHVRVVSRWSGRPALTICSPCLLVVALAVGGLYLRCRYPPTCSTLTAVANASPATWTNNTAHARVSFSWIFAVGSNRTGDLYVFDKDSKQCRHRTLRGVVWRRQCISSNATLRAGYSLGPDGRLNVQTWSFGGHSRQAPAIDGDDRRSPRPRVSFGAFVTVVPNTCVPVLVDCQGYVSRGVDQQQQELSRQMNIHDTNSLNDDESDYESYARYAYLF